MSQVGRNKARRTTTPGGNAQAQIDEEMVELVEAMREDLASFAKAHFPSFQYAKHLYPLVDALHKVEAGTIDRLMVFMPPRHSKSLLTSQMFPAWFLGRHPDQYVISSAYGQALTIDFGTTVKNIVTSDLYKLTFPEAGLAGKSGSALRLRFDEGGRYHAVGIGGPVTGRGAHVMLIDDPYKLSEEAQSETYRRKIEEWYKSVAYTRLQSGGRIIVIQTRWHELDLSGWLMREHAHENWHIISMPAIAEEDEVYNGEVWRRQGEALWPDFLDLEKLARTKQAIGSATWEALYQQRPSAREGAIYKRDWWVIVKEEDRDTQWPKQFDFVVQCWDTAFKVKKRSDRSACTTWGMTRAGFYLLDVWSGKLEFPDLQKQVENLYAIWNPSVVVIEDTASGQSLYQQLKRNTIVPIREYAADKAKEVRANAVSPLVEARRVFLPGWRPWVTPFIDEMARFPNGQHDDVPDTVSMALDFLTRKRSSILDLRTTGPSSALPRGLSIFGR